MDLDPFYMKESEYLEERLKQLSPWERYLLTRRPIIAPDGYIPNSVVRRRLRFAKPDSPPPPWQLKPVPEFDPRYLPEGWKARKDVNLNGSLNLKGKEDDLDTSFRGRSRYDGSSKGASVVTPVPLKAVSGAHSKTRFDYQTGALRPKLVNFQVDEDSDVTSDEEDERQPSESTAHETKDNKDVGSVDNSVGESKEAVEHTVTVSSPSKKKRSRREQKKRKGKVEVKLSKVERKEVSSSPRRLTREGLSLLQRIVQEKWFPPGVQPVLDPVTSELIKLLDSMDDSVFTSVCEYLVKIFHDLAAAVEQLSHIETLLNIQLKSPSAVISKTALMTLKQLGLSVKTEGVANGSTFQRTADLFETREQRLDKSIAGHERNGMDGNNKSVIEKPFIVEIPLQGAKAGSTLPPETKIPQGVVSPNALSELNTNDLQEVAISKERVSISNSVQGNKPSDINSNQLSDKATDPASSETLGYAHETDPFKPIDSNLEQNLQLSDQTGQRSQSRGGRKKRKSASRKPHARKKSGNTKDLLNREHGENIEEIRSGSPTDIRESESLGADQVLNTGEVVDPGGAIGDNLHQPSQDLEDRRQVSDIEKDLVSAEDQSHIKLPPLEHVVVLPAMSHLSEPFGSFRGSFDGQETIMGKESILFSDSGITGVSRDMTPNQALCSDSLDDLNVGKDHYMGVSSQAIKGSDSMLDRGIQSLSPIHSQSNLNTEHEVYTDPVWQGAAYPGTSDENNLPEDDDGLDQGDTHQNEADLKLVNRNGDPGRLSSSDVSDGGPVNLNHYQDSLEMVNMTDYLLPKHQNKFEEREYDLNRVDRSRHGTGTSMTGDEKNAQVFTDHPINEHDWRYLDPNRHGTVSRKTTIPKLPSLDNSLRNELILTFWDGPAGMNTWEDPLIRTREKDGSMSSRAFTTSMTRLNPGPHSSHCEHYRWATKKMHHYISISNFLSYTCLSRTMADLSTKVHQKPTYFGRSWQQSPGQFQQR